MLSKLIFISFAAVSAFFNPSIKLSNGRTATLNGRGPPVLFSTGLFGTMPAQFYTEIIKYLKHNLTIVTIDGAMPITPKDVVDLADSLKVDQIAYIGHSSFNPEILETGRINNAVLIDPIVLPNLDVNGILSGGLNNIEGRSITIDYPVLIIKSEKLYQSKLDLPTWQELEINGDVEVEIYDGVGHPDILDDQWANIAKNTELWGTAQGKSVSFKDWKLDNKNTVPAIRKEYRNYTASRILQLINNEPPIRVFRPVDTKAEAAMMAAARADVVVATAKAAAARLEARAAVNDHTFDNEIPYN
tara:strand:+ start:6253 stop:7158 length:906 start_codon:yes stop_codon:yes gene_type:complete